MARNNFLILDSDLHMMEPDDLWARWLDEPYRQNPPRFFGGQREQLKKAGDDKGNTNSIMGMEVQGLQIPAHNMQQGATVSSRELRRRSRARHPHFQLARARGYDAVSTLTAMDIEGIDVAVMYGTRGRQILCHDDLKPDYAAALARAYNNWAADYCKTDPTRLKFAAQIAMHDVGVGGRGGAAQRHRTRRGRGDRYAEPGQRPASARRGGRAAMGRARGAGRADRLSPDRQYLAEGRCRTTLCRACQFPSDRARDPEPGRADGGDRQPDHRRGHGAPSEAARRLPRGYGGVAAVVAVAPRRPVGEVRAGLREPAVDASERILQAAMLYRARCRRGAGGHTRSTISAPITLSCRATIRIPTARSRRRSGSSSACRSRTSSAARSCGTIAPGCTASQPFWIADPRTAAGLRGRIGCNRHRNGPMTIASSDERRDSGVRLWFLAARSGIPTEIDFAAWPLSGAGDLLSEYRCRCQET